MACHLAVLLTELARRTSLDELIPDNNRRADALVVRGNRRTVHRRDVGDPAARRIMHRTPITR